ncbi:MULTISPECIES: hypothetical protein [Bacillus]|uniref:hypothetical protein n=1 Tax=Bacillus TaxID=1386 RepID=UPI002280C956|nr:MULTISPECIES: hypothetical protein [Bacillus]MCY8180903.1 hypothetical protein [Bacillus paralicheniformis]MCY8664890.1 hypothetical protein [Bacillus haynesii]MCY8712478.1 hypothetical protein [Bacillus haynesii]
MISVINLKGRSIKTKGCNASLKGNQIIINDFEIYLDGDVHNMEAVGFSLQGDDKKRILYKLYVIKDSKSSISYHLSRIELDQDGFNMYDAPENAIFLLSEIYIEKNGMIAGVVYTSTDEIPYTRNADLVNLPPQFNIRIDESIFDEGGSERERERDVQDVGA